MCFSSKGTPGVKNNQARLSLTLKPQAVPTGLSTITADAGSIACLRLLKGISRLLRVNHSSKRSRHSAFSTNGSPFAFAIAKADISSLVGPRPPLTRITSACKLRSWKTAIRSSRRSPTVTRRWISTPCSIIVLANQAALVSTICPANTSSPVQIISNFISDPYLPQ